MIAAAFSGTIRLPSGLSGLDLVQDISGKDVHNRSVSYPTIAAM